MYNFLSLFFYTLGYANIGNNENFHLLHFAVHQTNENRYLILFFAFNVYSQYQMRLKILRHPYKIQIFKFKIQQKVLNKKNAE